MANSHEAPLDRMKKEKDASPLGTNLKDEPDYDTLVVKRLIDYVNHLLYNY